LLIAGAVAMVSKGLRRPLPPFEALLCSAFTLGLVSGSAPYFLVKIDPRMCLATGSNQVLTAWIGGAILTGFGGALTAKLFKPRLRLNRVAGARWFWLAVNLLLMAASYAALDESSCMLEVHTEMLLLPAISNAILGLSVGWVLSERDPG
jgi:hypothetical protein